MTLVRYAERLVTQPGRVHNADGATGEAVALLDGVVYKFPAVTWYRRDRGEALLIRGGLRSATGRGALAKKDIT